MRWIPFLPEPGPLCVYTCAMAIRRSSFDTLGGFDVAFDFLDSDIDFCMSAWRQGWKVHQAPELTAFHVGGGSPQATSARVARFYKNRWLLLRKHGKIRSPRLVRLAVVARLTAEFWLLRALASLPGRARESFADKVRGRAMALEVCRRHYA